MVHIVLVFSLLGILRVAKLPEHQNPIRLAFRSWLPFPLRTSTQASRHKPPLFLLLPRSLVPTGKNSEHEPPKSLPQFSSSVPFFGVYIFPFSFVFSLSLFLLDFLSFSNTHTTHSLPSSGLAVLGIQKATDEPCRLSPTTFLTQPPSRRRRRLILVPLTLRTGNRTRKLPSGIPSCGPTGPMATPTIATLLPPTTASMSPI